MKHAVILLLLCCVHVGSVHAQHILERVALEQLDSTTFELSFKTDAAAIVTVHVAEDTTYRSAFIFLGRTVGTDNAASITFEGLSSHTHYFYRVFLGTDLYTRGELYTGPPLKK